MINSNSIFFLRYISRTDWKPDTYPEFCTGMAYIMSPGNAKKILASFEATMKETYIWMEDVYITGLLANISNIEHENIKKFTRHPYFANTVKLTDSTIFY
jgi:hypothetical protein